MSKVFSWTAGKNDWAILVLRVVTGLVFFMHGYQKLTMMGIDGVTGFLTSLGFPLAGFFAVVLIATELLGGLALMVGLGTRYAASLTTVVTVVAFLTVHMSKGFFIGNGGYEFIIMLFAASVALVILGAGKYSADRALHG